jgi:nitric oxide reductase subunit B
MIGASYYMLTDETEHEGVHLGLGKIAFWILTAAVDGLISVSLLLFLSSTGMFLQHT